VIIRENEQQAAVNLSTLWPFFGCMKAYLHQLNVLQASL
jgi:hypothetical protein